MSPVTWWRGGSGSATTWHRPVADEERPEMSPAGGDRELVSSAFTRLADTLVDEYDVIDLLDRLVGYSVDLLAVEAAGIVLGDVRGTLRVVAASNDDAQLMELLQLQNDEGPCLECYRTATAVSVPDLAGVATIGILQERAIRGGEVVTQQLQTALNNRVVIEQAKGVLAERGTIPMDVAFDRLRRHSRRTNQLLSRVARRIVERELDPDAVLET